MLSVKVQDSWTDQLLKLAIQLKLAVFAEAASEQGCGSGF